MLHSITLLELNILLFNKDDYILQSLTHLKDVIIRSQSVFHAVKSENDVWHVGDFTADNQILQKYNKIIIYGSPSFLKKFSLHR